MIPQEKIEQLIQQSNAVCAALSDDDDGLKRELLAHAGNRWSLGVVHTLGVSGRLRHADLGRRLHGVTQRMLTRTLRQLERDGLVARFDHRETPPRVEYELTTLGRELLYQMIPLWTWVVQNARSIRKQRRAFDAVQSSENTFRLEQGSK